MTNEEIERRVERAKQLFHDGFNCSQAVFAACSDIYGITDEALALRLAASFGGGTGRMRMTCGAANGMFLLAGLHNGSAAPHDAEGKKANYAFVQQLAGKFKTKYGSLICAELLGLAPKNTTPSLGSLSCGVGGERGFGATSPQPAERTPEYYEKRPCVEMVGEAVRIFLSSTQD